MEALQGDSATDSRVPFSVDLVKEVNTLLTLPVKELVPAASLTTFSIGGPVRALVSVETSDELVTLIKLLKGEGQAYRVLGNGSNVLFGDIGFAGWVIKLGGGFRRILSLGSGRFEVLAGASLMSFSRRVSDEGFSGFEFAAGIPASIGGAAFMNAGAHGSEIASRIVEVRGISVEGRPVVWAQTDLPWRYRHSGIPHGSVVTSVVVNLIEGDKERISALCTHNLAERRLRQPLALPSAGSVFKNPSVELPAGRLLEELGMKGFSIGGAKVSDLHANWIVNPQRTASAADVIGVMQECQRRAHEERGIELESEVRLWI